MSDYKVGDKVLFEARKDDEETVGIIIKIDDPSTFYEPQFHITGKPWWSESTSWVVPESQVLRKVDDDAGQTEDS